MDGEKREFRGGRAIARMLKRFDSSLECLKMAFESEHRRLAQGLMMQNRTVGLEGRPPPTAQPPGPPEGRTSFRVRSQDAGPQGRHSKHLGFIQQGQDTQHKST